ncbi:hypothetical protein MRX96_015010 [Rhipicephalus microplus]
MSYRQLEESVDQCMREMKELEKSFIDQATLLSLKVKSAQLHQKQLEHGLDYVAAQQNELERLLAPLEAAMNQAPTLSVQHHADLEREVTYRMAEDINSQLNSTARDAKDFTGRLNAAHASIAHEEPQCHRTHHRKIERLDGIVRYLTSRLKEKESRVLQEPHYRTSQGTKIPDLVIHRDQQSAVLDVQVVATRVALSEAYKLKRNKYLFCEFTKQINRSCSNNVYRGTWTKESVNVLTDVGLGHNDFKVMSIRCMLGGLRAFSVHQKSTVVRPRR